MHPLKFSTIYITSISKKKKIAHCPLEYLKRSVSLKIPFYGPFKNPKMVSHPLEYPITDLCPPLRKERKKGPQVDVGATLGYTGFEKMKFSKFP